MPWPRFLRRLVGSRRAAAVADPAPGLRLARFRSLADYRRWTRGERGERAARRRLELELVRPPEEAPYPVVARCYVCERETEMRADYQFAIDEVDGRPLPNWRERLLCPGCALNNRMRATLHLAEALFAPGPESRIYLTEQSTPLYERFAARHRHVVGSEHLGDRCPLGSAGPNGWRNEDLTRLTFADAAFDLLVCLDVLEHLPDTRAALAECRRVLAPGGTMLLTVPFRIDHEANLVRARLGPDGEVEHLMEPEIHGDPLDPEGCLAFYHFGWQLLDQLRAAGFADVSTYVYWSRVWGYLGAGQTLHVATKAD